MFKKAMAQLKSGPIDFSAKKLISPKTKKNLKSGLETCSRQVGLIVLSIIVVTIFLALTGYDPFAIVKGLVNSFTTQFAGTVRWATPLILAGLAVCVTFKAGLWNLGVDGQIYMGAAAGAAVALYLPVENAFVNLVLIFGASMIAGALYAMIPAILKVYLKADEIVSTLLLNFVAVLYVEYLVTGPLRDPNNTANLNATAIFPENQWLPRISYLQPSVANYGFYIALILTVILAFIFFKTSTGREIKVVGSNPNFAKYAGINPKRTTFSVFLISGGIAGIIGAIEMTGIQHRLLAGFNPDFGMEGIVVTLLGSNNPIGVLLAGFFFGALKNGGNSMERITEVPSSVTEIIMAVVILTLSVNFIMKKKNWKFLGKGRKDSRRKGREPKS